MGNYLANTLGKSETKVAMFGIRGSGKTTLLYNMKLGEVVTTIPTIGFNVETITHHNFNLTLWDVNGSNQNSQWRHFLGREEKTNKKVRSVIFVVDSSDRESMEEACVNFWRLMSFDDTNEFKEVLIYATKQDVPNAMSVHEINQKLELDTRRLPRNINWYVQGCSGLTGSGLFEGLSWLTQQISNSP